MDGLKPGRIVYYVLDTADVERIQRDRHSRRMAVVVRNEVLIGDVLPAMVVRVWDQAAGTVSLKVMLDGSNEFWATSVGFSAEKALRSWHWMFEGQATRYQPDRTEIKVGGTA